MPIRRYVHAIVTCFLAMSILSQEIDAQPVVGTGVTLPLQGIDIDLNPDGSWKAIYATGVQVVAFPDTRGVNNAYVIAEERAKAAIARYFEQKITTGRVYTEAEETLEKTLRSRGNGNDQMTATASRALTSSLKETFASSAQAVLRGVTILEQTYDEKAEEVRVKVGISRATIASARSVQQGMRDGGSAAAGSASAPGPGAGGSGLVRPPSETRSRALPGSGAGTPAAAEAYRPFVEARGYVRGLKLRDRTEWDAIARSGDLPRDVPPNPETVYRDRWVSWSDWLGLAPVTGLPH